MKTSVHFPQRRFDCDVCGKPFTENREWIDPKRRQTNIFETHIYERVKNKTPRKQVTLEEGLYEATVLEIFKHQAERAARQFDGQRCAPWGDEILLGEGHKPYALVLSDLERRRVIAVLPDRLNKTFEEWLEGLTEEERRGIYLLKEEFRTICDRITDRARAERFLSGWIWKAMATGSRYLIRFVKTRHSWWHEFLNCFDDRVPQGFVEGINRAIRGIINRAFGYRNFDNFRLQVLVECTDG